MHAIDDFTLSVIAPDEFGLKPDATVWVARAENDAAVVLGMLQRVWIRPLRSWLSVLMLAR
ncbi:hypothetical protein [Pseudoglutamicibacter albus]|uniref:hypothetical protein n=1 Tax=Pseudoglutamicibacter albus TaxID=98671 RepID=UPI00361B3A1F